MGYAPPMTPQGGKALDIVLAVWGDVYVTTFLDLCAPTLLASGNIPAIGGDLPHRLRIFTTVADADRMAKASVMVRLVRHIAVEYAPIPVPRKGDNKYHAITRVHLSALTEAQAQGAAVVFLAPDFVLGDGTLRVLAARAAAAAIMMMSPRAALDEVAAELGPLRAADPEGAIALAPRALMAVCLRHPHAITESLYWDAPAFSRWPSILQWRVDPVTMLARSFHPHPLLLDPARLDAGFSTNTRSTIDGDLFGSLHATEDEVHVVTDSDELLILELSRPDITHGLSSGRRNATVEAVATFARYNTTPANRGFVSHLMWYRAGDGDPRVQAETAARSNAVITDMRRCLTRPPTLRNRLRRVAVAVKRYCVTRLASPQVDANTGQATARRSQPTASR